MSTTAHRRTLRLRTRATLAFSLTALAASLALAVVTYAVARNYLLDQRISAAQSQAFNNAKTVRDEMRSPTGDVNDLMLQLPTEGSGFAILVLQGGQQQPTTIALQDNVFPPELVGNADRGVNGIQRFDYTDAAVPRHRRVHRRVRCDVLRGVPARQHRTHAAGHRHGARSSAPRPPRWWPAFLGWWTNRRLLRPLTRVAKAAGDIASGGLDTRMPAETDPDLDKLAQSFNDMADAVQTRLEREARFASDVSHELRSPITALSAAVEVLDARRADLPDRAQQALDVVVTQVRRFDQMVMDLLELSRIDAGSTELHREDVDIGDLVSRIAHRYGFGDVPIEVSKKVAATVRVDKLRFERVLANLLDNANQHGGGPTRIAVDPRGRHGIVLVVEDAGPGVAQGERARIFERFARGSAARHRIGTGLGLSLVAEHAQAHGGEAWVEDRPGGGARFLVTFGEVA